MAADKVTKTHLLLTLNNSVNHLPNPPVIVMLSSAHRRLLPGEGGPTAAKGRQEGGGVVYECVGDDNCYSIYACIQEEGGGGRHISTPSVR